MILNKNKNKKSGRKIIFKINIFLVSVLAFSFFLNLVISNDMATQKHETKIYKNQLNNLKIDQQKLTVKVAELQSSDRLSVESERLNLVKADTIKYISPRGSVALKD